MKVFISYAREDYTSAKKLFDYLKRIDGIEPWLDKESLLPGMDWKYGIMVALRESRFVILLLSPCLIHKSGYVQHEMNYPAASGRGICLLKKFELLYM
jgi:hypothetical protein